MATKIETIQGTEYIKTKYSGKWLSMRLWYHIRLGFESEIYL